LSPNTVLVQTGDEFALRLSASIDKNADGIPARPGLQSVDPLLARLSDLHNLEQLPPDPDRRSRMVRPPHLSFNPGPELRMGGGEAEFLGHGIGLSFYVIRFYRGE